LTRVKPFARPVNTLSSTMNHALLHHRNLWSLDALSSGDLASLLRTAESLKAAAAAGRPQQPLRGKNIAVMCESGDDQAAQGFTAAASALGARVSYIRPGAPKDTASLLGKLYDAIECEGLPDDVVRELERGAGRPVFNGLGEARHPLRVLGDLMTLREHSGKPLNEIRVCLRADPDSPASRAWRQSALLAGFSLSIAPEGEPASEAADFIWDEHDGQHAGQKANHHYALQALLCSAVA
jgi:ornithine carbamoyltransferase